MYSLTVYPWLGWLNLNALNVWLASHLLHADPAASLEQTFSSKP